MPVPGDALTFTSLRRALVNTKLTVSAIIIIGKAASRPYNLVVVASRDNNIILIIIIIMESSTGTATYFLHYRSERT